MNSQLRGKVGILAHREQLHIIFLLLSHDVITTLLCNFADAALPRCSVQPSLPRVHGGLSEEHGNAIADSLYIRRHTMVSILLIVQKQHLLGLHSQQMARTRLFPGQETSLLFDFTGKDFKNYWFDVHECFACTCICTPEEGIRAHRTTLIENSGALCGYWECNLGPLSALNHWDTSPDPSLGNFKSIFILNCVYAQVDTCKIAGRGQKSTSDSPELGLQVVGETLPRMLRSKFRSSEGVVLTVLFSCSSRFLKILYSY